MRLLSLLCLAILAGSPSLAYAATNRPNILFLLADDQRADALSSYGNRDIKTPHIDRIGRQGVVFDRAYIMGGMQGAVCVPSRAMILSGRSLFRVSEKLDRQLTWPEYFGSQGYRTFITGKWHNQLPALLRSFQEGKSIFLGGMSDQFRVKISDRPAGAPSLVNQRLTARHSSEEFSGAVIEFLRSLQSDQNFVAYCAFTAPHDPRQAPPSFLQKARASAPKAPANFLPQHPFDNGEMVIRDEKLEKWPRTSEAISGHWADYKAIIEHLDEQIGHILAALEQTGRASNTIIVFAGDNGLAVGSHGLMGKQNLYEHSMRVPLIVSAPGLSKNTRSTAMCYLFDLFPTLCELASLPIPSEVEGQSLLPVLRNPATAHRTEIFHAYKNGQRAINDGRHKLIRYPLVDTTQLFDLSSDPGEVRNLATQPAHAATVKRLLATLAAQQTALGDKQALSVDQPNSPLWTPPQPDTRK